MDDLIALLPLAAGLALTGAVSGVLAGLLGIGGGAILVPALAFALEAMGYADDVVQHVAVGTSLAIIIPTGISSALSHRRRDAVDVRVLKLWAPVIVVATFAGGLMAGWFSGDALRIIFGVMAFFIAANIILPFQQRLIGHLSASALTHRIFAALVGYVSALMGVGGGALSVPTIAALGATMHRAVGTGAAIGVFIAISGAFGYVASGWGVAGLPPLSLGFVNLPALVLIGILAAATAPLGATLAHRLDQKTLKRVFAVFLLLVGSNMIWKAIAG